MNAALATWRSATLEARLGAIAGVVAILWSILILDPFGPATIDPDASASVLYFQHLVSGQRLESFVPTTPKPLLTLEFGLTWIASGDWRELVWMTIAAFGVGVGSLATFVARLAQRAVGVSVPGCAVAAVGAASFATAALLSSSDVMLEVSRANSLIWALAFWAIAGLGVTEPLPRPRLIGVALLFAGLCRFETLALAAVAVVAVVVGRRLPSRPVLTPGIAESGEHFRQRVADVERQRGIARWDVPDRDLVVAIVLSCVSLPIALLHDWLLTGDPLYWLSVPARYTTVYNPGLAAMEPLTYAGTFVGRIAPEWPLLLVAVVGVVALARSRQWLSLAGIAAIAVGVAGLLFWLALRATYISNRYYEPIDLALTVAGSVGVGWVVGLVARTVLERGRANGPALASVGAVVGLVIGAVVVWPALPWDKRATTELSSVRDASDHAGRLVGYLHGLAGNFAPEPIPPSAEMPPTRPPTSFGLLVPSRDVSRLSVETGLALDVIGDLYAAVLAGAPDTLRAGQWLVHDSAADRPVNSFKPFEVDAPNVKGRVEGASGTDIPGVWIDRITP